MIVHYYNYNVLLSIPPVKGRGGGGGDFKTFSEWEQRLQKAKPLSCCINGFPDGITLGQQYNMSGEKPPVIL